VREEQLLQPADLPKRKVQSRTCFFLWLLKSKVEKKRVVCVERMLISELIGGEEMKEGKTRQLYNNVLWKALKACIMKTELRRKERMESQ
jgi:hypothetical protein